MLRLNVASPRLRTSYFASVQQYREFYIDLLMRLSKDKPSEKLERIAFNASETGRARSLLQLLSEAGGKFVTVLILHCSNASSLGAGDRHEGAKPDGITQRQTH